MSGTAGHPLAGLSKYSKDPENPRGTLDRDSLSMLFPAHHSELIRVWGSSLWACLMLVFYETGARPGEVRALTWADIDIRKRFVPFRKGIEAGTADKVKGTKPAWSKRGSLMSGPFRNSTSGALRASRKTNKMIWRLFR